MQGPQSGPCAWCLTSHHIMHIPTIQSQHCSLQSKWGATMSACILEMLMLAGALLFSRW